MHRDPGAPPGFRTIESFGNPKLALPADTKELCLAALRCYSPETLLQRLKHKLIIAVVTLGIDRWAIARKSAPFEGKFEFDFAAWIEDVSRVLNEGQLFGMIVNPSHHDGGMLYVHLLSSNYTGVGFVKIAFNEKHQTRLSEEARILEKLSSLQFTHLRIPKILRNGEWRRHRYLILEPLPLKRRAARNSTADYPAEAVREFAGPLVLKSCSELWWWPLYAEKTQPPAAFHAEVSKAAKEKIGVCRIHGDMKPGNVTYAGNKTWIFDWERSVEDAPRLSDEVFFWIWTHRRKQHHKVMHGSLLRAFARCRLVEENRTEVAAALAFFYATGCGAVDFFVQNWGKTVGSGK